jgi:Flp pilus assembly protein TadD
VYFPARGLAFAVLGVCALLLGACGGSAPVQPSDSSARTVVETAPTEAAAAESVRASNAPRPGETQAKREEPSRRDQRRAREAAAAAAAAGEAVPIPEDVAAQHSRAVAAMANGNWLEAAVELEELVAVHPEYPGPYVNLAIIHMRDGRNAEAHAALDKALAIDATHAAANNQLGMLLRREGQFTDAEAAYRRAIATDPQYSLAHYNLGVLLDLYLRRPSEALECYEYYQSMLAEPNQTVGRWIVDLRRRLGMNENATRVARETGG